MNRPDGEIRQARSQGIQVALAVSLYGMSFGALAMVSGFSLWQTMVLSLVMFSGASQFAVIGIVATGGVSAGLTAVPKIATMEVELLMVPKRAPP